MGRSFFPPEKTNVGVEGVVLPWTGELAAEPAPKVKPVPFPKAPAACCGDPNVRAAVAGE